MHTHMLFSRVCTLLCALVTVDTAYTIYFVLIHHCTNSLSSLHIFVHHCTFCASLHTKTSPDVDPRFLKNELKVLAIKRASLISVPQIKKYQEVLCLPWNSKAV